MNYHVGVGVLLLDDVPVGVGRLLLIIGKQLLQGRQGSVSLGFLLVGTPPFELLPVDFHLRRSGTVGFFVLPAQKLNEL